MGIVLGVIEKNELPENMKERFGNICPVCRSKTDKFIRLQDKIMGCPHCVEIVGLDASEE